MSWNEPSEESLHELLQQARWPEADAEQLARIERRCHAIRARQRRMARMALAAAVFVAATIAVGSLAWRGQELPVDAPLARSQHATSVPARNADRTATSIVTKEADFSKDASSEPQGWQSRAPNLYERTILLARRDHDFKDEPPRPTEPPMAAANGEATSSTTAEGSHERESVAVEDLFAALVSPRVSVRLEAARALGELNDPAISARLVRLALNGAVRREALMALLNSSDPVATDFLAYARTDVTLWPSLRAAAARMNTSEPLN